MSGVYANVKKVHGPYFRKDGRKHVIIIFNDGSRKTVSYPKFLIENLLGRQLGKHETVDHINCDFTDNRLENLQVLSLGDHVSLDNSRLVSQEFSCLQCSAKFSLVGKKLSDAISNRRRGKAGPYCSRSCAGKASHRSNRITQTIVPQYTTLKITEPCVGNSAGGHP